VNVTYTYNRKFDQPYSMVADLCLVVLSCFRSEKAPRENPPNGDFFVFSHGDLSPRHTKVRDIPFIAFSATVCRIFAWRGERSPCEIPTKSPFGGFSRGDLSRFRPENTFIRHGINQPPYYSLNVTLWPYDSYMY